MYLKNIETYGFKSFANKIDFVFHDGITGIVGPNGSGKSNIADALRWVLGEQSVKQLRGGNMQDVIFQGTENRKPLSYASVSITLDNSDHVIPTDYNEITITRKLYRSGESEYLINGTACRLKDINEMFYDTGIGKEGYSIIGQNQIDKILSGKPEDRRELFDEAAGIVKYKRRKYITEKKLDNEKSNLLRVTDILDEINKQLVPLEEQSEKAHKYLSYRSELKTLDANMFIIETDNLLLQEQDIKTKIDNLESELTKTNQTLEQTKKEYQDVENYMEELTKTIEDNKDKLNKSQILKGQLENQIEILKEQISSSSKLSEQNINRKNELNEQIESKKTRILNIEEKNNALKEENVANNEILNNLKSRLNEIQEEIEKIKNQIEFNNNKIIEELKNRADNAADIKKFEAILEQNKIEKAQVNKELISYKSKQEELSLELSTLNENKQKFNGEIEEKKKATSNLNVEIETLQKQVEQNRNLLNEARSDYERDKTKLESLIDLTESYEGYGGTIKAVMEKKNQIKGIVGVVGDIINLNKKYEIAIETALASNIQNIIVEDENVAKTLINYLKENKLGRATFLPITLVRKRNDFKNEEALNNKGVLGIASTLVECDDKYSNIISNLLGGIVVVDTIDNAIELSRKYKSSFKMVTLDGEFINTGGAISGGTYKNRNYLLSRKRLISELETKVKEDEKKVKDYIDVVEDTKNKRINKYNELDSLNDSISNLNIELNKIIVSVDNKTSELENINVNLSDLQNKLQELDNKYNENNQLKTDIDDFLKNSEDNENTLKNANKVNEEKLNNLVEDEANINKDVEECNIKISNNNNSIESNNTNKQSIEEEVNNLTKLYESLSVSSDESLKEKEEKENNIKEIQHVIEESKEDFIKLEQETKEKEEEKAKLNNDYKSYIDKREELTEIVSDLDKEKIRLENNKENLQVRFDNYVNYMWEEYELSVEKAKELKNDELTDIKVIKDRIKELKSQIKALGNVNINSIEDYKNIKERSEFLTKQRDDIVESKEKLTDIIKELEEGMKTQFAKKFKEINKEYNKVFADLFGGGKGSLELMDEKDLLDTGIKIIAQPPGKKLQNVMQLSGGEKALTAIALLFAIQNLRPSPFCLLDEIEAALDDSNVTRFAQYLTRMTKNTQFIVITHRRGTMQVADRLYGITMQEKGVSTLVSVDLVEKSLDK